MRNAAEPRRPNCLQPVEDALGIIGAITGPNLPRGPHD
jgi:hypothetical protein